MGMVADWPASACRRVIRTRWRRRAEQNGHCGSAEVSGALERLADALDNRIEFGVWGGMTERERRACCGVIPRW